MSYEEKYNKLVNAVKILKETNPSDEGIRNWVNDNVPELAESEDERIRKALITFFLSFPYDSIENAGTNAKEALAWLEKRENQHKPFTFKALPRLLEMVDRNERSISYGNKLAEALKDEGYTLDSNIVKESIKLMKGEDVPLATMDDQDSTKSNCDIDKEKQNSIAPKFRSGDKISNKEDEGDVCTIKEIKGNFYILTDGTFIKISEQDEYRLIDTTPKFKVGDWIVNSNGKVNQVTYVNPYGDGYTLDDKTYMSGSWCNSYHLWTLKDAKDGDILVVNGNPFIYSYDDGNNVRGNYCCIFNNELRTNLNFSFEGNCITPANKEQGDLLVSKMKESGYEWDTNNGGLKKIESKPAWSDVDEADLNNIIWLCNNCIRECEHTWIPSQATRIKSLIERIKDTIFLQPKQNSNVDIGLTV